MKGLGFSLRKFSILFGLLLFFLSCQKIKPTFERKPSSEIMLSDANEPCLKSRDCAGSLICRQGWCRQDNPLGEAEDSCLFGPRDCRSGVCSSRGKCVPNISAPADNGVRCLVSTDCRSGVCSTGICFSSQKFLGLTDKPCFSGSQCVSGVCDSNRSRCAPGGGGLASQPYGQKCQFGYQCFSGRCANGLCGGVYSSKCVEEYRCAQDVGRKCGAVSMSCEFNTDCCSGMCTGNVCQPNFQQGFWPCTESSQCRSGYFCSPRSGICKAEK